MHDRSNRIRTAFLNIKSNKTIEAKIIPEHRASYIVCTVHFLRVNCKAANCNAMKHCILNIKPLNKRNETKRIRKEVNVIRWSSVRVHLKCYPYERPEILIYALESVASFGIFINSILRYAMSKCFTSFRSKLYFTSSAKHNRL